VLDMIQEALNYEGFDVHSELKTDDILASITECQPDIIILDYLLSGINGGELCHQIKSNKITTHLPVILVSAYPRVFHSLGDYQSDAFISKPFDLQELTDCINNLIPESLNHKSYH
jgi:DNA-binding response OmpR family regulator